MTVKAKIGQPAPPWRGKAVLNDQIKELSLDDYKVKSAPSSLSSSEWTTVLVSKGLLARRATARAAVSRPHRQHCHLRALSLSAAFKHGCNSAFVIAVHGSTNPGVPTRAAGMQTIDAMCLQMPHVPGQRGHTDSSTVRRRASTW